MREGGRWTDRAAVELDSAMKEIGMAREEIQAKASEIVADTLNNEQLALLRKTMAESDRSDG